MAKISSRSVSAWTFVLLTTVILAAGCVPGAAQSDKPWVEPRYNPPVGSRWSVATDYRRDESTDGKSAQLTYSIRSKLTIDGKSPEGYRITYVTRDMTAGGTSSNAAVLRAVSSTLKGVTVHAIMDASGKPLRVGNIDEVHVAMQKSIDQAVAAKHDSPESADLFRQMLTRILMVDARQAATIYLDSLPSLALGQNTGLKPGEERREIKKSPNPMGGEPMQSVLTVKLVSADLATGKARLLKTEQYERESLNNMIAEASRRLAAAQGKNADEIAVRVKKLMQSIKVERSERTEIDVEGGMTRAINSQIDTTSHGLGVTFVKHEVKTITVTRLP